jgi:rod shape-determining protein MreD
MSVTAGFRLIVTAFSMAAVQALLIEQWDAAPFRHLDLPLAVAIAMILTRPAGGAVIGFVFGLAVDVFQLRLFGLHCLAYCTLGPIAANLPVNHMRRRSELVAMMAAVQSVTVTAVIVAGVRLFDGQLVPGLTGRFVQVTLWSVAIAVPLTALLGARVGLSIPDPVDRHGALSSAGRR